MPGYFLDTSALVKRYVAETGHAWVVALCDPTAGNAVTIWRAALVEAVAAFCRRAREASPGQHISESEQDRLIDQFRRDARREYGIISVTTDTFNLAGDLCKSHRLRAYDAVQLACALTLRERLAPTGVVPTFVCADANLLSIAAATGLTTEDPNMHP